MNHYRMLAINLVLSSVVMYLVMFTMIDGLDDFYNNANMAYMTAMMVAPMVAPMGAHAPHVMHSRGARRSLATWVRSSLIDE